MAMLSWLISVISVSHLHDARFLEEEREESPSSNSMMSNLDID